MTLPLWMGHVQSARHGTCLKMCWELTRLQEYNKAIIIHTEAITLSSNLCFLCFLYWKNLPQVPFAYVENIYFRQSSRDSVPTTDLFKTGEWVHQSTYFKKYDDLNWIGTRIRFEKVCMLSGFVQIFLSCSLFVRQIYRCACVTRKHAQISGNFYFCF